MSNLNTYNIHQMLKPTTKYKYTPISEMNSWCEYNFYSIIIDASFPIFEEMPEPHYEITIKVIDNTFTQTKPQLDQVITIIIKSPLKEKIPYIHTLGEIIRINCGLYQQKKKRLVYMNLTNKNVANKASWCIFKGIYDYNIGDYTPLISSESNFNFEQREKIIIDRLREFYLENNSEIAIYDMTIKLKDRTIEGSNKDAIVLVVHKEEQNDKIVLFIQDDTDGCELHTFKYFNFIKVNEVIRVRAFKLFDNKVLVMNNYSNILRLSHKMIIYKQLLNKLLDKLKEIDANVEVSHFPLENTKKDYNNKQRNKNKKYLIDLKNVSNIEERKFDEVSILDKTFILSLNVICIKPIEQIVKAMNILCTNCNESFVMDNIELEEQKMFNCQKCKVKVKGKIHFNMQLICRETKMSNELIIVYLCNYDGEGNGFLGVNAEEIYNNGVMLKKLEKNINKIMNDSSNYIRVMVQQYDNRILRIIGQYSFSQ